jgi:hypothetical protein
MTAAPKVTFLAPPVPKLATVTDFVTYRITMVEQLLNRADLDETQIRDGITRHCRHRTAAEVDRVIAQHAELIGFLPPEAVPSTDEESEYEALAYELYAAIKALVSVR